MAWQFRHDGHVYKEGDVTVDQWIEILDATGARWATVNPFSHPQHAKTIFSVIVADETNVSREDAAKVIGAMSTDDFLALFQDTDGSDELPKEFEDGIPQ